MSAKKMIGLILLIGGLGMMAMSMYITSKVDEGKAKLHKAEKTVHEGSKLFSMTPATKELSEGLTSGVKEKFDDAHEQIVHYEAIANGMQYGGIAILVLGAGMLLFRTKRK
jgi:hypothetical protein